MLKLFSHLNKLFLRRKALMRLYRIKGWTRGRSASRWATAFLIVFCFPFLFLLLNKLFWMPMDVTQFSPAINKLLSPWDGFFGIIFVVYCASPFLLWGAVSLFFLLLGVDINERK